MLHSGAFVKNSFGSEDGRIDFIRDGGPSVEAHEIIIFNHTSLPAQYSSLSLFRTSPYLSPPREIVSDRPLGLGARRPLNSVVLRLKRANRDLRISRVSIYRVREAGIIGAAY